MSVISASGESANVLIDFQQLLSKMSESWDAGDIGNALNIAGTLLQATQESNPYWPAIAAAGADQRGQRHFAF